VKQTGLVAVTISGAALFLGACSQPNGDISDDGGAVSDSGGAAQGEALTPEEAAFDSLGLRFEDAPCDIGPFGSPDTIRVRGGAVGVDKQPVLVCRGEEMVWAADSSVTSWEITWKRGNSPLHPAGPVRSGANGQGGGRAVALGRFEYGIRAVTTAGDTIELDPDVVILPGTFRYVSQ